MAKRQITYWKYGNVFKIKYNIHPANAATGPQYVFTDLSCTGCLIKTRRTIVF